MQRIPLTQKEVALVDDRDYGYLMQWKWYTSRKRNNKNYARRGVNGKVVYIHRIITNCPIGKYVDHINGDGLDNRRKNLRICTNSQNGHNADKQLNSTSGHKGVSWHVGKWEARICINRHNRYLGRFADIKDAVLARKKAEEEHVGEFAFNN